MTLLEHVWLKPIYFAEEGKRKKGEKAPIMYMTG